MAESKPKLNAAPSVRRPRLAASRDLPNPTQYVQMLTGEYAKWAFDEDRAKTLKGAWREKAFNLLESHPLDLEIGTGNGGHFSYLATQAPQRALLGIEIKFKPLIQSIRRALAAGAVNARIARYDASLIEHLFAPAEIDNIFIHHPDPWPKKRQWKHRLIQDDFTSTIFQLQKSGSFVDFKTDSEEYYNWAEEIFTRSPYEVVRKTRNLHGSVWRDSNFVTHFEKIFLDKGQPIFYTRLLKP